MNQSHLKAVTIACVFIVIITGRLRAQEDRSSGSKSGAGLELSDDINGGNNDHRPVNSHGGDSADKAQPQSANDYIYRARVWMSKAKFDEAIKDFTEAIRLDPKFVLAYFGRARANKLKGNYVDGVTDYTKALDLNPRYVPALINRANIYNLTGNYDLAVADCERAAALGSRKPLVYVNRAIGFAGKGEYQKATSDYNTAINFNPTCVAAYGNLAWLQATCPQAAYRDGKKAVANALKACELMESPRNVDILAAACAEAGDFVNALKWESQALENSATTPEMAVELKQRLALYQSGQPYHQADNTPTLPAGPESPEE